MIILKLDRERGGEIELPGGVRAEVRFADAPLAGATLRPGRHKIERS
jgi:hypothetical protein